MVSFKLNGTLHSLDGASGRYSRMSLAQFIREEALLTGTKVSCGEGGCGACTVTANKEGRQRAVNSCLTPVLICDGWEVTTVEGLGGRDSGYHPIQSALAETGGSQCGYCSPGMVMALYSRLQDQAQATALELEDILDGNICRCTGYRPILDTVKQFSSEIGDIEDIKRCHKTGDKCSGKCVNISQCKNGANLPDSWHQPRTLTELTEILAGFTPETRYRLVGGNTGTGVFKRDEESYDAFVNINEIAELKTESTNPILLGGNVSITDAIAFFTRMGQAEPMWLAIARHLGWIASVGIRNQGTLAGNLMMKNAHPDFPSDVFICLATVGALLEILNHTGDAELITLEQFINMDMNRKLIKSIHFSNSKRLQPKLDVGSLTSVFYANGGHKRGNTETYIRTFKIMPRSTNAHAYVNAGFLAEVDRENNFLIIGKPSLVFGGVSSSFTHARNTENYLMNKSMNDQEMFQQALNILANELNPDDNPALASKEYRKQLALSLLYKFFLHVLGSAAAPELQSGAAYLERGLTSGQQSYDTEPSLYPVSEPIEKVEGRWQTSGEIMYTGDTPVKAGELQAAFVLSSRANCDLASIDVTEALAMPGVVDFVDHRDVPGVNNWKPYGHNQVEEIFSSGRIHYAGQSLGLILAETRDIALEAARRVKIVLENEGPVITDMETSLENPDNVVSGGDTLEYGDAESAINSADHVIQGRFKMGSQYHFHMETQTCIVTPVEDGFDLDIASQDTGACLKRVCTALNIDQNSVNITVKRLGGGFGGKVSLPCHLATAAAVAANKLKRPVRLWMPLEDNMKMLGKRSPYLFDYKGRIGVSHDGKIQGVDCSLYCDGGWSLNDVDSSAACVHAQSCYNIPNIRLVPHGVRTDTQPPTATRSPGILNGLSMMEAIMEHAAGVAGWDPLDFKLNNLMEISHNEESPIAQMVADLKISSDYTARVTAAHEFNGANRWKKRGIATVPMRYYHSGGLKFNCLISVFAVDGTVSVTHSGIEMGQGLNTKVVQCIAYELGIDVSMIKVKPVTLSVNPNTNTTGGSFASESVCVAAVECCNVLNQRLAPIRGQVGEEATWPQLIQAANEANIDLCSRYMMQGIKDGYTGYNIWGAAVTEVELDILTGEMRTVRVDLVEDAGLSTSPLVDIGQVEGAFIMGLGLWTSEEIKHDPETGALLTMNTWEYKPPAAKDIPQDFRVTLLKGSRNPKGIMSSKATGEPPILLSISVLFAIKAAINSARTDAGLPEQMVLNGPSTVEHIHQSVGISTNQFVF